MPSDRSDGQLKRRDRQDQERRLMLLSVVQDAYESGALELGKPYTAYVGSDLVEIVVRSEDR
jgi:hypothetical protein